MATLRPASAESGFRTLKRRRLFELLEHAQAGDRRSMALDVGLMGFIFVSLVSTTLESVPEFNAEFGPWFFWIEVTTVAVFTVEYVLRVACAVELEDERFHDPFWGRLRYMASPIALADLLAVAPFYVSAFVQVDLRLLRLLRLLRILKLSHYFSALGVLLDVLKAERHAIGAAYFVIAVGIVLASTGIYVFEHEAQPDGFASIPAAIYWAIVTLSTVGYGDVVPITTGGRILGAVVIMLGVGNLTIPTGIIATGFALEMRSRRAAKRAQALTSSGRCASCGSARPAI